MKWRKKAMDYAKESLKMHYELRGKLEVTSRAAVDTKDALILPIHRVWRRRAWKFRKMSTRATS